MGMDAMQMGWRCGWTNGYGVGMATVICARIEVVRDI